MSEKRALIVDDDYANRSLWELVLSDRGYEVMTAGDITTGKGFISPDVSLYLVDYHLPDGHGTDLVSEVRGQFPTSMVVMVSMDDDADVIREAMRAGGNVFMVKPASPAVMGQILNEIESGDLNPSMRQLINRNGRRSYA
jgi:two-component system, HptB-dependent secretion and biofilm response regulator